MPRRILFALCLLLVATSAHAQEKKQKRYLYVATPGIRNYLEFGGAGILVFDIDDNHKFVKRIKTPASAMMKPENIKGLCGCAATKRLYFTTLMVFGLLTPPWVGLAVCGTALLVTAVAVLWPGTGGVQFLWRSRGGGPAVQALLGSQVDGRDTT